jgi:ABC-2 type transport system permease protein
MSAAPVTLSHDLQTIGAMMRRSANELIRVPGAAIPGVLAPTIFFLGLTAAFGNLIELRGFDTESYQSFLIPVSMLQGAGFTGAAMGVNLARDIEVGLFDRFLASPAPRWVLLAGLVLSASVRALIPATVLLVVALAIGAHFPGLLGLLLAIFLVMWMAIVAACWGVTLALRFKTQAAAPLMQSVMLALILCTTAYAPQELLTGWLYTVAEINPITQVVEAARQGFTGTVTWAGTWPGIVALLGFTLVLGGFALRGMRRTAY